MRSLAALLTLCLLIGALPAASLAAEPPASLRGLEDAIRLGLTSDAWLIDSEQITGSISNLMAESQRRAIVVARLNATKAKQRALARLYRTARREASGPDRACERAVIDLMYQQERARLQAEIVARRAELGYVDRQKVITKLSRFLGSVAKQTVKRAGPELIAAAVSGGLGGGVAGAIFKRHLVRFGKEKGQEFLTRVLVRQAQRPIDVAFARAQEACQAGAEETTEATPVPTDVAGGAGSVDPRGTHADAACEGASESPPSPPFEARTILIYFDWEEPEDRIFDYTATTSDDPIGNPYDGPWASWSGGCAPDAIVCSRPDPLILTEVSLEQPNHARQPGSYTLLAGFNAFCSYDLPSEGGPSYLDMERLEQAIALAPVEARLTATIAYYEKGNASPYRTETRSAAVPVGLGYTGMPEYRRTFGDPIVLPSADASEDAPWD